MLPPEDFESWGWRLPFLFGIVIGIVGIYIRKSCGESPAYEEARREGHISDKPVREAFAKHPKELLLGFCMYMTVTMPFYLISIYLISFTEKELGRTPQEALLINFITMLAMLAALTFSALLSDRIGRKRVMMPAAAAMFAAVVPLFMLMGADGLTAILLAQVMLGLLNGLYIGPVPAVLVELFPTSVRYTGMALAYNFAAALFGGTAPMVCVWLIRQTGTHLSVAWYVMLCCLVSFLALYFYKDRYREPI
jgi:MHS family proline/betaine transporter-like MFS transporter